MQIDERVVDGVTILDLKGKMTLGEGDELLKDKINSLDPAGAPEDSCSTSAASPTSTAPGLGEIVRTYTTVSRQGGQPEAAEPDQADHGSAGHHQAADGVRDVRVRRGRRQELLSSASACVIPPRCHGATLTPDTRRAGRAAAGALEPLRRPLGLLVSLAARPVDEEPGRLRRADFRAPAARTPARSAAPVAAFVVFCALSGRRLPRQRRRSTASSRPPASDQGASAHRVRGARRRTALAAGASCSAPRALGRGLLARPAFGRGRAAVPGAPDGSTPAG